MKTHVSIVLLVLLCGMDLYAAPPSPNYQQGFEGEGGMSGWKAWAQSNKNTSKVNFVGSSTEKFHSGKQSLKFDLTFHEGSYCYWSSQALKIPATGNLKLSGYLFVEQLPAGVTVAFGRNLDLPPSKSSGVASSKPIDQAIKQWQYFEIEIGENTAVDAKRLLGTDKVFRYVDRVALMFRGRFQPGQRAVVYVDDLKVSGEAKRGGAQEFETLVAEEAARQMEDLAVWKGRIEKESTSLQAVLKKSETLPRALKQHVLSSAQGAEEMANALATQVAGKLKGKAWIRTSEAEGWKDGLEKIQRTVPNLKRLLEYCQASPDRKNIIFLPPAITDQTLLPKQLPVAAAAGDVVELSATPGEYEPATFAIFSSEEMRDVTLQLSDLKSGKNVMPAAVIDLRVVKVWYQAGIKGIGGYRPGGKRYLVPELLLKDDDLIWLDGAKQRNLMRHRNASGDLEYVDISDPDVKKNSDVLPQDSAQLQPFTIPANSLKQLWLTAHIPKDAKPGDYLGRVRILVGGKEYDQLTIKLTVLPFLLEPCPHVHSFYHHSRIGAKNRSPFQINYASRSEAQLEAELRNMNEHGLTSPITYQEYGEGLIKVLEMRKRVGMPAKSLFTIGQRAGNSSDPKQLESLQQKVKQWVELAKKYGYQDVYIYGFDEAKGDEMASQRAAWKAVRDAGGKTFAAGYQGSFEAVGDLQDLIVLAYKPDPKEAEKYHSVGHQIFSYANPQCGPEVPETFRRNYGLLLWKSNFDGAMDYAYHRGFGHVWNDFDDVKYRDHVMAYPTVDGVIDTLQWEGYREAVDDTRYLATLQKRISEAGEDKRKDAEAAKKWLEDLDIDGDLYVIRNKMIEWILKLSPSN